MTEKIQAALAQLDPANENHWTADGLPRLDTVKLLAQDSSLTREAVTQAQPGFSRASAMAAASAAPAAPAPAPQQPATPAVGTGPASGSQAPAVAPPAPPEGSNGTQQETNAGAATVQGANAPQGEGPSLQEQLGQAQRYLDGLLVERADLDKEIKTVTAAVDKLIEAVTPAGANASLAHTLQGYLARQQEQRDMRAARIEGMKGIKLSEILPTKAVIDQAYERRRGRAGKRPTSL